MATKCWVHMILEHHPLFNPLEKHCNHCWLDSMPPPELLYCCCQWSMSMIRQTTCSYLPSQIHKGMESADNKLIPQFSLLEVLQLSDWQRYAYPPYRAPFDVSDLVKGIETDLIAGPGVVHSHTCLVVSTRARCSTRFSWRTRLYLVCECCFSSKANPSQFLS